LVEVEGLSLDHSIFGTDGADQILAARATDDAVAAMRALGFTVDIEATPEEQSQALAQVLQDGGPDITNIDVA
jgi:hypothetical protein